MVAALFTGLNGRRVRWPQVSIHDSGEDPVIGSKRGVAVFTHVSPGRHKVWVLAAGCRPTGDSVNVRAWQADTVFVTPYCSKPWSLQ